MSRMHPLILGIALISSGCIAENKEYHVEQGLIESLLKIADQEPQVGYFIAENPGYKTEITVIAPENITKLSEKYPAIYGNLPNRTLYEIEYGSGKGMLVIIDPIDKKVLRYFRTANVTLG